MENLDKKQANTASWKIIAIMILVAFAVFTLFKDEGNWEHLGYIFVAPVFIALGVIGLTKFIQFSKKKIVTALTLILLIFSSLFITYIPLTRILFYLEDVQDKNIQNQVQKMNKKAAIGDIETIFKNGTEARILRVKENYMLIQANQRETNINNLKYGSGIFMVYLPGIDGKKFEAYSETFPVNGDDHFVNQKILFKLDEEQFKQDKKMNQEFSPLVHELINQYNNGSTSINFDFYNKEIPTILYLNGKLLDSEFKIN